MESVRSYTLKYMFKRTRNVIGWVQVWHGFEIKVCAKRIEISNDQSSRWQSLVNMTDDYFKLL